MHNFSQNQASIIRASEYEIKAHAISFLLVIWPISALVFPTIILYFNLFGLTNLLVLVGFLTEKDSDFVASQTVSFFFTSVTILLIFSGITIRKKIHSANIKDKSQNNLKRPIGKKGEILNAKVQAIWKSLTTKDKNVPEVRWFTNFNVVARASSNNEKQEIWISSGLWERIVNDDTISAIILKHEMAHLVHNDPFVFRLLDAFVLVVRVIVKLVLFLSIFTTLLFTIYQLRLDLKSSYSIGRLINHFIAVLITALLLLLPMKLGELAIRRYGGFITSLIELRADIFAGLWGKGVESASYALKNDSSIRQSSISDLGHSLVSVNLTHISESERIALLNSPERLSTPKLRYFLLTLTFALALPLNMATPLMWGGSLDHIFIVFTIVVLVTATFLMILNTQNIRTLSWQRCAILGVALCVVMGLSQINLYQLGYVFTAESAALLGSNSFTNEPLSYTVILRDIKLSLAGLLGELKDTYFHLTTIFTFVISIVSIRISVLLTKRLEIINSKTWALFSMSIIVSYLTILATFDPWRGSWYEIGPLLPALMIYELTESIPGIRLGIPILFMPVICFLALIFDSTLKKKMNRF